MHLARIVNVIRIFSKNFHATGSQSVQSLVGWKYQRQTVSRGFSVKNRIDDKKPNSLQVLESAGVEPTDREVSKLERMADESGEIERETFTAYAKKSEAFKEYMEAERKSGIDKAEIAFKVNL